MRNLLCRKLIPIRIIINLKMSKVQIRFYYRKWNLIPHCMVLAIAHNCTYSNYLYFWGIPEFAFVSGQFTEDAYVLNMSLLTHSYYPFKVFSSAKLYFKSKSKEFHLLHYSDHTFLHRSLAMCLRANELTCVYYWISESSGSHLLTGPEFWLLALNHRQGQLHSVLTSPPLLGRRACWLSQG